MDIWTIIYSATDGAYRADHMEDDLRAYYNILLGYLEEVVDYTEFRQELEERRVMGMVMYGTFVVSFYQAPQSKNLHSTQEKFTSFLSS